MEDLTGRQFGPYQIVAPLGEGGMAAVYKAYQPAMERYVALKVLPRHFATDPQFVVRFQREAVLLAKLQHPHILPVFDYGQADGYTYIVMPFVQSGTLTDSLKGQPLNLPRIRQVISQVGDALNYAHAHGLIHRDVKPSNVLIDEGGNCLLTDFGLARMVEDSVNLTTSGAIMGTPAYMSPEQGSGQKVDSRSDIYSLGVILYEMATGRVPYKAETPIAVVFKHIQDPLPPANTINPQVPEMVELVIFKALAKSPEDRYPTAGDMVRAIQAAIPDTTSIFPGGEVPIFPSTIAQKPAPKPQAAKPVKKSNPRWWMAIGGMAALLVMIGMFYLFWGNSEKPAQETSPATATAMSTPVVEMPSTDTLLKPSEHRIGVRVIDGVGEFYSRVSGDKFVPRGMNYVRLADQTSSYGESFFGNALFAPGLYDSTEVGIDLQKMHKDGYNVVRVYLSPEVMGTADDGLSPAYMKNVADFLEIAKRNQIYVIFTHDWLPGGKYDIILGADCCSTFALMNAHLLPPAGLKANQVFYRDFISALLAFNAPTEYIFSYQIRNELYYDTSQPPLSFDSGIVETANGKSYDMSKGSEKRQMVEENLVYWIDEMRASILEVDPTALVSVGFFHPQEPNSSRVGDPRLAVTEPAIWQSTADFIDLHAYSGYELNLQQHVENYGINGMKEKPIIMGEFGGNVNSYPNVIDAALAFRDWQVESCKYGFDGWIFWTWDTDEQPELFNALMNKGAINGVLAPVARNNPCLP